MCGIPALDLWDLEIEVLHSSSNQPQNSKENVQGNLPHDTPSWKHTKNQVKTPIHYNDLELCNVDYVSSNAKSAQFGAMLYIFEDDEAVIKMIIMGRSPTMRHVSRTQRVALDWLFDRINQDKNQIKYIDTKNQLADILTKGNFTRDEWNHLLNLFNISHFSSAACTAAMAKRAQQGSGEGRVTAKSRPMMNLTARTPSFVSSSASSNPGRTSYGHQDPGKSVASDDRSGKPEKPSPPGYSIEDYGQSWSSQEWKSGAAEHDR